MSGSKAGISLDMDNSGCVSWQQAPFPAWTLAGSEHMCVGQEDVALLGVEGKRTWNHGPGCWRTQKIP